MAALAALASLSMAAGAAGAPTPAAVAPVLSGPLGPAEHYAGIAYSSDGGQPVYREEHWVYRDADAWQRLVLYRCPRGPSFPPFARKLVRVPPGASPYAPDFDLADARTGYREGVRETGEGRQVYVRENGGAAIKTAPLRARRDAVIDAGFDAYVRGHWDRLAGNDDVVVSFLVPSRLDYLDLKLGAGRAVQIEGREALRLRMKLDAWYGFAAPSLEVFYSVEGHRLLRFQGISNIRDEAGKSQSVRIEFPADLRFPPPEANDIERAAALPLVAHCP